MFETKLRRAATAVLQSTMRIAPPDVHDWGQAMMAELGHVESCWTGTMWALGSSSVLARHAVISWIRPGPRLLERSAPLGKSALIATVGCILAVALFTVAPTYRQAFQLSLAPWHWVFELSAPSRQTSFRDLARRAESMHDAEGMAFCAIRIQDDQQSARLAEEAVQKDPSLVWVYAATAINHPKLPQISQWIPKLERSDPQNALIPMIAADNQAFLRDAHDCTLNGFLKDPVRINQMQAAFQAEEFDDYSDRVIALECKVMPKYGAYLPDQVLWSGDESIPFADTRNYAQYLLVMGRQLEDKGARKDATDTYWIVAHHGEVLDLRGHTRGEHMNAAKLQMFAYNNLRAMARKDGNEVEAAHFAYLVDSLDPMRVQAVSNTQDAHTEDAIARWNAWQVIAFGLLMPVFIVCLAAAGFITMFKWRNQGSKALHTKRLAAKIALMGSVGLFLSSAMLYSAFHPYAEILNRILSDNEPVSEAAKVIGSVPEGRDNVPYAKAIGRLLVANSREATGLRTFLAYTQQMPFKSPYATPQSVALDAVCYFWLAVIVLGLIAILLVAGRHFRPPPNATIPA